MAEEMEVTLKQAAEILGLNIDTIGDFIRDKSNPFFRRAHLLHGARKKGYRIPIGDIDAYARSQGGAYTAQVSRKLLELSPPA